MSSRSSYKQRSLMFERVIKAGFVNFVRNAWLAAAAIAVMVITLTIVLFSVIANAAFANSIRQITDRIDVSMYLKDDISRVQRDKLVHQLGQIDNVKSVHYISKDEALTKYRSQNKNESELLLVISQIDNPLPASMQIKPKDINNLQPIKDFLERPDIKKLQSEKTSYSGDLKVAIDNITHATQFFQQAGLVGVGVFALISMLIIFNTIRMAIFNRRDELNIMRLLGASTWYIRGPFIVETVLYGLIAALVSVGLCQIIFTISSTALQASTLGSLDIGYASSYFRGHLWLILTSQILIGIVIGAASSYFATRRYLKFKSN